MKSFDPQDSHENVSFYFKPGCRLLTGHCGSSACQMIGHLWKATAPIFCIISGTFNSKQTVNTLWSYSMIVMIEGQPPFLWPCLWVRRFIGYAGGNHITFCHLFQSLLSVLLLPGILPLSSGLQLFWYPTVLSVFTIDEALHCLGRQSEANRFHLNKAVISRSILSPNILAAAKIVLHDWIWVMGHIDINNLGCNTL